MSMSAAEVVEGSYEKLREENIRRNEAIMRALGRETNLKVFFVPSYIFFSSYEFTPSCVWLCYKVSALTPIEM